MTDNDKPSKSELKRRHKALKDLGERLLPLKALQLSRLPITEELRAAVSDMPATGKHGARKRQLQYIGKLMQDVDAVALEAALDELDRPAREENRRFHQAEAWRERLLGDDAQALTDLINHFPGADSQRLGQLVRRARQDVTAGRPRGPRELFKALKALIDGY